MFLQNRLSPRFLNIMWRMVQRARQIGRLIARQIGPLIVWLALIIPMLSACVVRIDEARVFQPQRANTLGGEVPGPGFWGETVFYNPDVSLTLNSSFDGERVDIDIPAGTLDPAEIEHGKFTAVGAAIAWTYAARPAAQARPLIIHCGGNSFDRWNFGLLALLKLLDFGDVVLFDYPGFGYSEGPADSGAQNRTEPSVAAFVAMEPVFRQFVDEQFGARPRIYWGHSLGGFVCARLSVRDPASIGLVLEATAATPQEAADAQPPAFMRPFVRVALDPVFDPFDTVSTLNSFAPPVLVLAGEKDRTLPARLSRHLYDDLKAQGLDVDFEAFSGVGHTNIPTAPGFAEKMRAFLTKTNTGAGL